jgi:ABC-type uncharacterized transport system involved in gliding motility auxiliary subunit
LYLVLIAALAAAGIYLVMREWNLAVQISLGLVLVGLALFAILDPERVRRGLGGRQARYGSNAVVMTVAFVGILVVVNYLVFKTPKRWDLTENQQFTLAPETVEALGKLPQPVKALAFYTARMPKDDAEGLLNQFKFKGQGNFDYEFINPEEDPLAAQNYKVTRDGTVVLVMGDLQEQVTFASERDITGGLLRLISPGTRAVYFLTGHGEFDPMQAGDNSYSLAKSSLEAKNYTVNVLNLLTDKTIPEDAEVIVIAGPLEPLTEEEVQALGAYLENGGALVVMEEPVPVTQFGEAADPLAVYLSEKWGIDLGSDMVIDLSSNQPFIAVSSQYGSHAITDKLRSIASIYPTARSVQINSDIGVSTRTDLVLTSDQSWAETDLQALAQASGSDAQPQIAPDEGVDLLGPVTLAVSAEDPATAARLVVFGDSEFASDVYFQQLANGDVFINTIDWLTEQEALINLTPKEDIQRFLLPPGRYTMNLVMLGSVILLPGLILLAGVGVWFQRRRRG